MPANRLGRQLLNQNIQLIMLPQLVEHAKKHARGWAKILDGFDHEKVDSREALATLPIINKARLRELQAEDPPFGGLECSVMAGESGISTIFVSPGPVFEPARNFKLDGKIDDIGFGWRMYVALAAAGIGEGDIVLNCFSYHRSPAGAMMEEGVRQRKAVVIPSGPGDTSQQVQIARMLKPTAYTGTPDFLKAILDRAEEEGEPLTCFKKALVSGGALYPSLREEYRDRGIDCRQCYATADVGLIATEEQDMEGMAVNQLVMVEIVRPGTSEPVPVGEVGEVVVTSLDYVYPMFRYATGDLSAFMEEGDGIPSYGRIKGWMGRADQSTKVKGVFVHASQVAEIARRCNLEGRLRLEVSREGEKDLLLARCESMDAGETVEARVREAVREVTGLSCKVRLEDMDTLPNDGKVIADLREYEPSQPSS